MVIKDNKMDTFKENLQEMIEEKQTVNFLFSCISEGLIPVGLRKPFNLSKDVNNKEFVNIVQLECDKQSSRLLDLFLKHSEKHLHDLKLVCYDAQKFQKETHDQKVIDDVKSEILKMKRERKDNLNKKLSLLREMKE